MTVLWVFAPITLVFAALIIPAQLDLHRPGWRSRFRRWWTSEEVTDWRYTFGHFLLMVLFLLGFLFLIYAVDAVGGWDNQPRPESISDFSLSDE